MERSCFLVIIRSLLHIVSLHFCWWNIAVINMHLPIISLLVVDMIIIYECFRSKTVSGRKVFITIHTILINRHSTRKHQFKDIGKEIHLTLCWLYRIIQGSIGIICEIEFTIDVSSPNHVLIHRDGCREIEFGTQGHIISIRLLCLLLSLLSASRWLCHDALHHSQKHEYE